LQVIERHWVFDVHDDPLGSPPAGVHCESVHVPSWHWFVLVHAPNIPARGSHTSAGAPAAVGNDRQVPIAQAAAPPASDAVQRGKHFFPQ
jgi:hypothetical protein